MELQLVIPGEWTSEVRSEKIWFRNPFPLRELFVIIRGYGLAGPIRRRRESHPLPIGYASRCANTGEGLRANLGGIAEVSVYSAAFVPKSGTGVVFLIHKVFFNFFWNFLWIKNPMGSIILPDRNYINGMIPAALLAQTVSSGIWKIIYQEDS